MNNSEYLVTKRMLDILRGTSINEEYTGNYQDSKIIPVTKANFPDVISQIEDSLMQKLPNVKLEEDAFKLNKENNTVTLTGTIQNLNNLKFIITTDTSNGEGLYITVDGCNLSDEALKTLTTLKGYATVFSTEWSINTVKSKLNVSQNDTTY
jgi:hypothetical protein